METGSGNDAVTGQAPGSRGSAVGGALRFVGRHPRGMLEALGAILVVIVVLQNLEPTSLDVLFWSFTALPKLVLLLAAMVVGAALWELLRRRLFR